MEFTELADLALAAHAEGHRTLALADGTLILWNLEGKPQDFRAAHLEATVAAMDELREARVPVAGYISQPGSQELINALKLGLCPLAAADCDRLPLSGRKPTPLQPRGDRCIERGFVAGARLAGVAPLRG